ncbi:MAG TPA: type III-B CRISPR module-associated protein Cmr5 [Thiolinea sp.]|nr:type III-B CRISPR module-associated protein Cmr5 [Thiolinea sp.]
MTQTIQQQRAAYALKKVQAASEDKAIHSEYKSYASNLPAMIHMNGLGQAAAFFKAKSASDKTADKRNVKEKAYFLLYETLSDWLCSKGTVIHPMPIQPYAGCTNLLDGITTKDMHAYRLAQAEAQMLMDWVKKFAKAFMTEDDKKQGSGQ